MPNDINTLLQIHNVRSMQIPLIHTGLQENKFLGPRDNLSNSLDSKTQKFCQ